MFAFLLYGNYYPAASGAHTHLGIDSQTWMFCDLAVTEFQSLRISLSLSLSLSLPLSFSYFPLSPLSLSTLFIVNHIRTEC